MNVQVRQGVVTCVSGAGVSRDGWAGWSFWGGDAATAMALPQRRAFVRAPMYMETHFFRVRALRVGSPPSPLPLWSLGAHCKHSGDYSRLGECNVALSQ